MSTATIPKAPLMKHTFDAKLKGGVVKTVTAFRRNVGAPWTIKPMVAGKPRWMSMQVVGDGKADLQLLEKRAGLRLQQLVDGQFEPVKPKVVKAPRLATLGEIGEAYTAGIRLEKEIGKKSASNNWSGLVSLVAESLDVEREEVEKLSSAVLTREMVERWQDAALLKLQEADVLTRKRMRRSLDCKLRKGRAVFSKHAMRVYRKAGLVLPDLASFRGVPMKGGWNSGSYVPIDEVTLERMNTTAWQELKVSAPKTFLVYLMMLRLGMRNSEVEHARRSWIERAQAVVMVVGKPTVQEVAYMAVIARPGWNGPKNRKDHRIPIAPDVLAEIEALAGEDYLVGDLPTERWLVTHVEVCDFVRQYLPDLKTDPENGRTKAAYELRKHFGAMVASTQGLDRAAEYLGDRRDTVEQHYHAWLQNRSARPLLASELTPNVLAAVA